MDVKTCEMLYDESLVTVNTIVFAVFAFVRYRNRAKLSSFLTSGTGEDMLSKDLLA